ncbi:hypothetical protein AB1286_08660 [Trinickia sp. NRRL B-1857]|uniref:hypothetical protein n=1 Tax=Trinickia sp. NRRL B-1857 TaxID=3162879 RepID=UPI003D2D92FB
MIEWSEGECNVQDPWLNVLKLHPRLTRRVAAISAGVTQANPGTADPFSDAEPRFVGSAGR